MLWDFLIYSDCSRFCSGSNLHVIPITIYSNQDRRVWIVEEYIFLNIHELLTQISIQESTLTRVVTHM